VSKTLNAPPKENRMMLKYSRDSIPACLISFLLGLIIISLSSCGLNVVTSPQPNNSTQQGNDSTESGDDGDDANDDGNTGELTQDEFYLIQIHPMIASTLGGYTCSSSNCHAEGDGGLTLLPSNPDLSLLEMIDERVNDPNYSKNLLNRMFGHKEPYNPAFTDEDYQLAQDYLDLFEEN